MRTLELGEVEHALGMYAEARNRGDLSGVLEAFTEDVESRSPGFIIPNKQAAKRYYEDRFSRGPPGIVKYTILRCDAISEGPYAGLVDVATHETDAGVHTRAFSTLTYVRVRGNPLVRRCVSFWDKDPHEIPLAQVSEVVISIRCHKRHVPPSGLRFVEHSERRAGLGVAQKIPKGPLFGPAANTSLEMVMGGLKKLDYHLCDATRRPVRRNDGRNEATDLVRVQFIFANDGRASIALPKAPLAWMQICNALWSCRLFTNEVEGSLLGMRRLDVALNERLPLLQPDGTASVMRESVGGFFTLARPENYLVVRHGEVLIEKSPPYR